MADHPGELAEAIAGAEVFVRCWNDIGLTAGLQLRCTTPTTSVRPSCYAQGASLSNRGGLLAMLEATLGVFEMNLVMLAEGFRAFGVLSQCGSTKSLRAPPLDP